MDTVRAYEEVVDFIAAGTNPGSVIAFSPSAAVKERVACLIDREKTTRGLEFIKPAGTTNKNNPVANFNP
jgi:hypothetical protein